MTATEAQRVELIQPEGTAALIGFLLIEHPQLRPPVRLVTDVLDHVWQAETWSAAAFGYRLVDDGDEMPRTTLSAPNIDMRLGQAIRTGRGPATIALHILMSDDFDQTADPRVAIGTPNPVYSMTHFETRSATVSAIMAEAEIILRDYSQTPWPIIRATQDRLPGVFR